MWCSFWSNHVANELFHIQMLIIVIKLTKMKMMYKPNSRRSITVPIISHSCVALVSWQYLSIWTRMAVSSLPNILSCSRTGSGESREAESVTSEMLWWSERFVALVFADGAVKHKQNTLRPQKSGYFFLSRRWWLKSTWLYYYRLK